MVDKPLSDIKSTTELLSTGSAVYRSSHQEKPKVKIIDLPELPKLSEEKEIELPIVKTVEQDPQDK